MKGFKSLLALALTIIMCVSLAACSTPGSKEEPKASEAASSSSSTEKKEEAPASSEAASAQPKILRYSLQAEPPSLDQQLSNSIPEATVDYHIFEGLMRNHVGDVIPGIAEKYEISPDGKTYTFYLRDAKWSDGVPIRAQDFEYGLKRLADPATASPYSFLITSLIVNAGDINTGKMPVDQLGVKAIDDKTLEIVLNNPTGYFLSMLSMPQFCPTRQDLVEKFGKDFAAEAANNAYSGPFMVKEWLHNDRIILAKNPNFWNADKIKLDEVHILTVLDAMTALAMFEQGDLDMVNIPPEVLENYKDKAIYYFDGANDFIKINMDGSNPLKDKDLRLAINYAINREDLVLLTTKGLYDANPRYVLPQVNGVKNSYGEEYPYEAFPKAGDTDKAKEHLAKAMASLGVSDASQIELELLTADTDRTRMEAEVIQRQVQTALGIKLNIRQVPYKQRLQMETDKDFQMVVTGWAPDYSDPMTYLELWPTGSPYNHGSYSNAAYDGYINEALSEPDPKKRMDALFNAEKTLLEDGGIAPIKLRRMAMLLNPKLKGFETYFVGLNYDYMYADFE